MIFSVKLSKRCPKKLIKPSLNKSWKLEWRWCLSTTGMNGAHGMLLMPFISTMKLTPYDTFPLDGDNNGHESPKDDAPGDEWFSFCFEFQLNNYHIFILMFELCSFVAGFCWLLCWHFCHNTLVLVPLIEWGIHFLFVCNMSTYLCIFIKNPF